MRVTNHLHTHQGVGAGLKQLALNVELQPNVLTTVSVHATLGRQRPGPGPLIVGARLIGFTVSLHLGTNEALAFGVLFDNGKGLVEKLHVTGGE